MKPAFETIIVGAGLAGASAALWLSREERVLVVEARQPAGAASGAAAGLVNPLMGRKARAVWQMEEALDAFHATLAEAGAKALFHPGGLLRPATEAAQVETFRAVAEARPEAATWLSADEARERVPDLAANDGALWVRRGGALAVPAFVVAMLAAAQRRGATLRLDTDVATFGEADGGAFVETTAGERLTARRVLLALGYGYRRFDSLDVLNLHAVKGQTIRVARPAGMPLPLPLSGHGYVVPEGETLVIGSSYERDFDDLAPSADQSKKLRAKAARMLPPLAEATMLDAAAGVRVTVPGTRLPMLGPLPGHRRVWLFTGLGSKGLLMAPLLARRLPQFFEQPEAIPDVVGVQIAE